MVMYGDLNLKHCGNFIISNSQLSSKCCSYIVLRLLGIIRLGVIKPYSKPVWLVFQDLMYNFFHRMN